MAPLLDFVLACVPAMVWQEDAGGYVSYANPQWREFVGGGGGVAEERREDWEELVHPGDLSAWSQRATSSTSPHSFECRLRKASDKDYSWHKVQSYYVEENGGSHVTIITNIHKERLMELEMHELRAREAVYKQLVSNSCDPVITFDADHGTIVTVNRAAEKAFQYPAAELIGKSLSVLLPQSYSARGATGMLAACIRSARHGGFVTVGGSESIYASRRDGDSIPVTISLADYVISSTRYYVAVLGVTKDETIKQEELRNSKDIFLRTMSHELRTPLFGLLGTLSTILDDIPHTTSSSGEPLPGANLPDSPHHRPPSPYHDVLSFDNALQKDDATEPLAGLGVRGIEPLQLVEHSPISGEALRAAYRRKNSAELRQVESCTRSLLSVVNNMITYYKIDMAVEPLAMPVQLRTLMKEVCGYFETSVPEGVVFSQEVKEVVPQMVVADANLLRHILVNLVSNALRFTNQGSVTVVIDVVEPPPTPDQLVLWISVSDTGIGIAPEFLSEVFQPFTQMDTSNTRKYGGAGLGLAVCKRVVDLMGGKISFNSGLGQGTTFEVSLPVALRLPRVLSKSIGSPQQEFDQMEEGNEEYEIDVPLFLPSNERRGSLGRFQSALAPIMENDKETRSADGRDAFPVVSKIHGIRRMLTPTLDALEDYVITTLPLAFPTAATTRKAPASAPASPRHHSISHTSPANAPRFLRRPSFPFILDDPSLSLMMTTPSPLLSSSSSFNNSPSSSPRSSAPSPIPYQAPLPAPSSSPSPSPFPCPSPVTPPPNSKSTPVFPAHTRVLVVDDNVVNQNVLKKMLKHMECLVITAQDGQVALNILFDETYPRYAGYCNFDLILMDCQMPVMDGPSATRRIRSWEADNGKPPMKIISLSASGSSDTERQCYESGSDGFIAKPVTLQGLCNVLSDCSLVSL